MKKWAALVLLATCAMPALAQAQFTSVTATVTDPNGLPWVNATVQATLVPPPGGASLTLSGNQFSADVAPTKTDATGKFTLLLADDTQIQCNLGTCTPAPQWSFQVDTTGIAAPLGTGPQSIVSVLVTISGASQDVSSQLSAAAPSLLKPILTSTSCTLVAGTCSHQFATPYVVAPRCTANGTTVANAMIAPATTAAVTVTSSSATDTQVVSIHCAPPIN